MGVCESGSGCESVAFVELEEEEEEEKKKNHLHVSMAIEGNKLG